MESKTFGGSPYKVAPSPMGPIIICMGKRMPLSFLKEVVDNKEPLNKFGDITITYRDDIIILGCLEESFKSFKSKVLQECRLI